MSDENKNQRFIKFIPGPEADFLMQRPFCFALLALVAKRARRESGHPDGLEPGEAYIGDWKAIGASRQNYRTALEILVSRKHFKILETNRNRKKSTTGVTTAGTKVKLLSSSVWDINLNVDNHRSNHCPTTDQPLTNHEQERIRTNQDRNKKGTIVKEKEKIVRPSFRSSLSSEDDLKELCEASSALNLQITEKDFSLWLRKFDKVKIDETLGLMLKQKKKIDDHAKWMQSALDDDWVLKEKNIEKNKLFAENFKSQNKWISLIITKKYCRDSDIQKDYYFTWPTETFQEALILGFSSKQNIG